MTRPPTSSMQGIGVMGRALHQQASPELAIALLRPTLPEHEIHQHQHADMHLLLLLAGKYVSDAAGMPPVCAEPAVILNPPGTEHRDRFRSHDGLFLTVTMPSVTLARLCGGRSIGDQPRRLARPSLARAMRLLHEVRHWELASPLAIETVFSELVAEALPQPMPRAGPKLQRVMERLEADGLPPPTLSELASMADLHPVYLARAFRKCHGLAPSDYLRKLRLHKAVSLIVRRRTLAFVAAELGFVDESHLHRCFVAEFGLTPGAFRQLALSRAEVACVQDARLLRR